MNKKFILFATVLAIITGCALPQKTGKGDAVAKNSAICGRWEGAAPDNSIVGYVFSDDGSVLWSIAGRGSIHAKYEVRNNADLLDVDIYDFDTPKLKNVRFIGIAKIEGECMKFLGVPSKNGRTPDGAIAARPKEFGSKAIVLHRLN